MAFVRACGLSELVDEGALAIEVDGEAVAMVRSEGEVFAIRDECSHQAVPLSDGDVEAGQIECFLHGSCFDLRTGKPTNLPATEPVPVYPVRLEGDDVFVDIAAPLNATIAG